MRLSESDPSWIGLLTKATPASGSRRVTLSVSESSPAAPLSSSNRSPSPAAAGSGGNRRAQIIDDSISFQIDSNYRDPAHPVPAMPLQLMEQQSENHGEDESGDVGKESEDEERVEEFRILGHPMCFKRKRDCDSVSSSPCGARNVRGSKDLESRRNSVRLWGNQSLRSADPDVFQIMEKEKRRQCKGIELIASENYVCKAVMEALGSHLTNKYSEGMPGVRYYGGNEYIDEIETLCCERALAAFGLYPENWGVNVQPYSCTSANFAVYTGLLFPGDRIMGLDTPSGGNTSHGSYLPNGRKVSGASIFFETLAYKVNPQTGLIDFEKLEERAIDFRPKILICGGSSYPREWDYARFRQIADRCGAFLMCDMAQISGLVAAKECVSPFDYCDIVTSTTHKSLRGPRGGIIFYRKGSKPMKRGMLLNQGNESDRYDFEGRINAAVFPALQGGPHNNHIAALAIALKQVATPEYKAYMQQVKKNAKALAAALIDRKCRLVTGGTDNHCLLWDLRPLGLTGKLFERVCELCHMTLNKILICDDNGHITPGGVRIGTPAMTSRGCLEADFETIADFLMKAAQIAISVIQREHAKPGSENNKDLIDLRTRVESGIENNKDLVELRTRVEHFASLFAMPGFEI